MRRIIFSLTALLILQAGPSVSTPAQSPLGICPTVTVECFDTAEAGSEQTYTAKIVGADPKALLSYEWTVAGDNPIISGQGTSSLVLKIIGGSSNTATVKVTGLPARCPNQASCSIQSCGLQTGRLFDQYGNVPFRDAVARLHNFALQLEKEPGAQGYIIAYGGKRSRAAEAEARMERAEKYLVETLGLDERRIVTVDGGYREEAAVELWIVNAGQKPPITTPTLRPEDVEIIDQPTKRKPIARSNR